MFGLNNKQQKHLLIGLKRLVSGLKIMVSSKVMTKVKKCIRNLLPGKSLYRFCIELKIKNNKEKKKKEFSKVLLIQESALIWIMTICFLGLAALCVINNYTGQLPWLTAMVSLPWTAYGVS